MAKWNVNELLQVAMPNILKTIIEENRLLHAINIEGDFGSGRTKLAHAIAGAILCHEHQGLMCGHCLACKKIIEGVHTDVLELSAADGCFKKDAIRNVRSEIYRSPSEGSAKVVILKNAQDMTVEVQNLLLKVIEEPPPDTYFIFTTVNRYMLLDTILSRVVTFTMPKQSAEESLLWLQAAVPEASQSQCENALLLTNYSTQKAMQMLQNKAVASHYELVEKVLVALINGDRYSFLTAIVPAEKNRQEYLQTLTTLGTLMNNNIATKYGISMKKLIKLKTVLETANKRCESNGYLQLISAAMFEEAVEKKG